MSAETNAAVTNGELRLQQAHEIVRTEAQCPGTGAQMRDLARRQGLRALKERGRRLRQRAMDPEELEARRREARELRTWTDDLGMVAGSFRLTPEVGVAFLRRLEAQTEREWRAGNRDATYEQRAADAFAALLEGKGTANRRRTDLVVVWNLNDDTAHIPAQGPVSMATVADVMKDAFVTPTTG